MIWVFFISCLCIGVVITAFVFVGCTVFGAARNMEIGS